MDTSIEWTRGDDGSRGKSWNPVVGCAHVSPGCDRCYAARDAAGRLRNIPVYAGLAERVEGQPARFTGEVRCLPERLDQPLRWRKPRRVFVNSMSDLFHPQVPSEFIADVFGVMSATERHTFQILTKRPARMARWVSAWTGLETVDGTDTGGGMDPLPNVWLGTSVESQRYAELRIPHLLATPAAVRFLSVEPLLGPLDLTPWLASWVTHDAEVPKVDWVIVGGESGPGARPTHPDWVRRLRDQCQAAGVAFFFKQWGAWAPLGPLYDQHDGIDEHADRARMEAASLDAFGNGRVVQLQRDGYIAEGHQPADDRTWLMGRVGKKAAGCLLDGRTWDQLPETVVAP